MQTFWPEIRARNVCGLWWNAIKSRHGRDIGQDVHDGATSSCQF